MGQDDVLDVLREADKPLCARQIADRLGVNISSVYMNGVAKMRDKGEIEYIEKKSKNGQMTKYYFI